MSELIPKGYQKIRVLSQSDKSQVFLVKDGNEEQYVCKVLAGRHEAYDRLFELQHPFLPKLKFVEVGKTDTIIIEEFINGEGMDSSSLTEIQIVSALRELCDVLNFLHAEKIIHRDIKPSNILIASDSHIRLIDFDAARVVKESAPADTRNLGTRGYAPPEQYGFGQTDERADIYAFGVTMKKLLDDVSKKSPYSEIIRKCTEFNPEKRYQSALLLKKAFG